MDLGVKWTPTLRRQEPPCAADIQDSSRPAEEVPACVLKDAGEVVTSSASSSAPAIHGKELQNWCPSLWRPSCAARHSSSGTNVGATAAVDGKENPAEEKTGSLRLAQSRLDEGGRSPRGNAPISRRRLPARRRRQNRTTDDLLKRQPDVKCTQVGQQASKNIAEGVYVFGCPTLALNTNPRPATEHAGASPKSRGEAPSVISTTLSADFWYDEGLSLAGSESESERSSVKADDAPKAPALEMFDIFTEADPEEKMDNIACSGSDSPAPLMFDEDAKEEPDKEIFEKEVATAVVTVPEGTSVQPAKKKPIVRNIALELELLDVIDKQIFDALSANSVQRARLLGAGQAVTRDLLSLGLPPESVVLYGSLSFITYNMTSEQGCAGSAQSSSSSSTVRKGMPRDFLTNHSDVDVAVLLRESMGASFISDGWLCRKGWRRIEGLVALPAFGTTKTTLKSTRSDVQLDLSLISDSYEFEMFNERQAAFQMIFWQTQREMHSNFGAAGLLAFDSFILLLKSFSVFFSRRVLTSFQVVCLGIFVVRQHRKFAARCPHSCPTSLQLFERFLRFCTAFFGDASARGESSVGDPHCKRDAIDVSRGSSSGVMPRVNSRWRAELYLADVERGLGIPVGSWLNVLHSADPKVISAQASRALSRWFRGRDSASTWRGLYNDLRRTRPAPA